MSISLSATNAIPIGRLNLNLTPQRISAEDNARLREVQINLYKKPVVPSDATYAEVRVGGKVVATLTNNGYLTTSNAMSGRIMDLLRDEGHAQGPQLAQERAEKIAKGLGGTVVKAPTAQTQAQWNARPPVTWAVDYDALERRGYVVPESARQATFPSSRLASQTIGALLGFTPT